MVSAAELQYTLEGVALGLREDGRALLDFRHCSLDVGVLPQAGGSCTMTWLHGVEEEARG